MFNLELYRLHWMFFALASGGITMLALLLWYLAVWKFRGTERKALLEITDVKSFMIWFQIAFPWILIMTIVGTFVFSIIYPQIRAVYPPNW